jgi:hypothetical protein
VAGYPPVDKLYYESPSLRIAGFIASVLEKAGSNKFNVVPGKSTLCRISPKHFDSLRELAQYLRGNHQESMYYRGQTKRYETTYNGRIDTLAQAFPKLVSLEVTFESMIPSLFRPLTKYHNPDWDSYTYPKLLDQIAPAVRAVFNCSYDPIRGLLSKYFKELVNEPAFLTRALLARLGFAKVPLPATLTAPMTNISKTLLQLISISQHYEYGSTMVDITQNVDVAVWLASHHWSGDKVGSEAEGVGAIYRFNSANINACLTKELENETRASLAISASGLLGVADISDLDKEFGLRPKAQSGGSILGMENSIVYMLLDVYEAMEVFTFPWSSVTGAETPIDKADLCPSGDPLTNVFSPRYMDSKEPISNEELTGFLSEEGFSSDEKGIILRARQMDLI